MAGDEISAKLINTPARPARRRLLRLIAPEPQSVQHASLERRCHRGKTNKSHLSLPQTLNRTLPQSQFQSLFDERPKPQLHCVIPRLNYAVNLVLLQDLLILMLR